MSKARTSDRNLLLILGGAMVLLIAAISLLARNTRKDDPNPTTYNVGAAGAKAAFLTLQAMGRNVARWDSSPAELASVDAAHTTLIFTEPQFRPDQQRDFAAAFQQFLSNGGRILLTGPGGAPLLPDGEAGHAGTFSPDLCHTTPEGPGPLAAVGPVEMADFGGWTARGPQFRIEQLCQSHPLVVRFPVGSGEAVWWSSPTPLTNAGLKNDANLKLLLASLDPDPAHPRAILFDEYLHSEHGEFHPLRGLPLWWIFAQFMLAFVLVVLSFSRRSGPLRMPVALPRSSPVEFAESMGDLYEKANATSAATDAARRRLLRLLHREAGVAKAAIDAGPDAIAETLAHRLGGDWKPLAEHLREASVASSSSITPRSALTLVKVLAAEEVRVREKLNQPTVSAEVMADRSP